MADGLRPLCVRLADPASAADLLAFLRRRGCVVEQVASNTFEVWPPPLLHEWSGLPSSARLDTLELSADEVACTGCGLAVEQSLSRLGSPRCHDCRGEPFRTPAGRDGLYQSQRARVELRAYLRAWRAETGGAAATLDR